MNLTLRLSELQCADNVLCAVCKDKEHLNLHVNYIRFSSILFFFPFNFFELLLVKIIQETQLSFITIGQGFPT